MVAYELRIIVEKVAVSSQEVVKRDTLKIYDIINPENTLDLGLRHAEQISLLEKTQNALLAEQAVLIEEDKKVCPVCGENTLTDEKKKSQLQGLYDYLHRNRDYLVNYESRKRANQIYTSQVAESHIDSLINARHKRSGKMQWSREGAHQVLQIRAMMASREWESHWQETVLSALGAVA